jgi:hypothetical protein
MVIVRHGNAASGLSGVRAAEQIILRNMQARLPTADERLQWIEFNNFEEHKRNETTKGSELQ